MKALDEYILMVLFILVTEDISLFFAFFKFYLTEKNGSESVWGECQSFNPTTVNTHEANLLLSTNHCATWEGNSVESILILTFFLSGPRDLWTCSISCCNRDSQRLENVDTTGIKPVSGFLNVLLCMAGGREYKG